MTELVQKADEYMKHQCTFINVIFCTRTLYMFIRCGLFFVPPENFSLIYRPQTLSVKVCNLTTAQCSWQFSSEVSLACHTNYGTENPFLRLFSQGLWNSHLRLPRHAFVTIYLNDMGLSRQVFEQPIFHVQGSCSNQLDLRRGHCTWISQYLWWNL